MGHGTTNITYRTYYKWMPKESRTDIDKLDRKAQPDATNTRPETNKGSLEWAKPLILKEAAPGLEPGNKGFADLCLSHLAMPPKVRAGNGI
jgi:hypothetical protein